MSALWYLPLLLLLIGIIWTHQKKQPSLVCQFSGVLEDDSDMKIAGDRPVKRKSYQPEADRASMVLELQRANGNTERARRLGLSLLALLEDEPEESALVQALEGLDQARFRRQRDILRAFSVKMALEARLIDFLEDIAFNVFMEGIRERDKELYQNIRSIQEFTLYLLCMRGAESQEYSLGKVFARLCGMEDSERLEVFGEMEYRRILRLVEQEVQHTAFSSQDGPVLL